MLVNKRKKKGRESRCLLVLEKNQGRPTNEIDLHGLFVTEASEKVEEAIQRCQASGEENLVIIVGKGLHSPGKETTMVRKRTL